MHKMSLSIPCFLWEPRLGRIAGEIIGEGDFEGGHEGEYRGNWGGCRFFDFLKARA